VLNGDANCIMYFSVLNYKPYSVSNVWKRFAELLAHCNKRIIYLAGRISACWTR